MAPLLLIAGLVLLVISGEALVRGAVSVAKGFHIPPIIIGLTIVAFGTSAPELVVSLGAALNGAPGLAIGNVIGSNITNTLLVLGLPAMITPMIINEAGVRRSAAYVMAVSFLLVLLCWDGNISRLDGLIMFALLLVYLGYSAYSATKARAERIAATPDLSSEPGLSGPVAAAMIVFGIIGLGVGGKLTTDGALGLAEMFGVENSAIGLTIVALGTSLPELVTSVSAALRKHTGVVIGNVLGSNIFNILGILGITSMVVPLSVSSHIASFDIWVMIVATLFILPIAFLTRRLNRIDGAIMTIAYFAYSISVFLT